MQSTLTPHIAITALPVRTCQRGGVCGMALKYSLLFNKNPPCHRHIYAKQQPLLRFNRILVSLSSLGDEPLGKIAFLEQLRHLVLRIWPGGEARRIVFWLFVPKLEVHSRLLEFLRQVHQLRLPLHLQNNLVHVVDGVGGAIRRLPRRFVEGRTTACDIVFEICRVIE